MTKDADRVLPVLEPNMSMKGGFLNDNAGDFRLDRPKIEEIFDDEDPQEHVEDAPPADGADDDTGGLRLPWGIKKRILDRAPPKHVGRAQSGDEVSVHLVTTLSDGTHVGSTREKNEPYTFIIDDKPREVIVGLELGVQTMKQGEIAEFTIPSRFAYGELGSEGVGVPPDTTIVCEVELLGWFCSEDLLRDGRAVKKMVVRGTGETKPKKGQDVLISMQVIDKAQRNIQDHENLDYTIGKAPPFGAISRIVDEALMTMVEGEHCKVDLRRFGIDDTLIDTRHNRAIIQIQLLKIYEIVDLSWDEDGSLMKKILSDGTGACVGESSKVRLLVDGRPFEFEVGNGDVCDALEFATLGMKVGERALVSSHKPTQYCHPNLGMRVPAEGENLALTVELSSCEGGSVSASAPLPERLAFATARKDVGASHFKQQRFALALGRYTQVLKLFGASDDKSAIQDIQRACELNTAACWLRMKYPARARSACDRVLSEDPDHIKALYRRASASNDLSDYSAAIADLGRLLKLDPKNIDARQLFTQIKEARQKYAKDAKSHAYRMILPAEEAQAAEAAAEEAARLAKEKAQLAARRRPSAGLLSCLPCGKP